MDRDRIIKGLFWLLFMVFSIMLSAIFLFAGFYNVRFDNYTILILGILLIPLIFFCAYKGFKLIIESIFY